jgi:hypothetical protein
MRTVIDVNPVSQSGVAVAHDRAALPCGFNGERFSIATAWGRRGPHFVAIGRPNRQRH